MSRGNPNFRDAAWRHAIAARNNGQGKAHSSWDRLAESRRKTNTELEAMMDSFDLWLISVQGRVNDILAEAQDTFFRSQNEIGANDEIPF